MSTWLDASTTAAGGGYGAALLETVLALVLVSALAWVVLRVVARRGFGALASRGQRIVIEERHALDFKNALLIVRVDDRRLLLATSHDGPAQLVMELAKERAGGEVS